MRRAKGRPASVTGALTRALTGVPGSGGGVRLLPALAQPSSEYTVTQRAALAKARVKPAFTVRCSTAWVPCRSFMGLLSFHGLVGALLAFPSMPVVFEALLEPHLRLLQVTQLLFELEQPRRRVRLDIRCVILFKCREVAFRFAHTLLKIVQ